MTVDYYSDFETINTLINNLGFNKNWIEYVDFILENKKLFSNQMLTRNESFYNQLLNEKKILKGLDKNYIKRQKTLFQVVLCFFQKDLKCFYLTSGHLTIQKQKNNMYGT